MTLGFTVAERVLYTPSIGYCMLLTVIIEKLADQFKEQANTATTEGDANKTTSAPSKPQKSQRKRTTKAIVVISIAVVIVALYFNRYVLEIHLREAKSNLTH